ncbi:MAG TPA: hypothetical protein VND64_33675 [Pirellulales bacterium]|nr:hypothetical protein [Pirellulales bacterium]
MDSNPYRSPEAAERARMTAAPAPPAGRRSWARIAMGVGCLCIALVLLATMLTTWATGGGPQDTQRLRAIVGWAAGSAISFTLMGAGMLANRDWLALVGLVIFSLSFAAVVVLQSMG